MTTHWQINGDAALGLPVAMQPIDRMLPGASPRMQRLKRLIEVVAPTDGSVLIQGETGTGKELVAQAVHRLSGRKGELVAINCAAIPADLLEGELFGYEKGAFTGADRARVGLIEQARGGTLFLDEIGDMPVAMQAKLLRVLESKMLRRVGGNQNIAVDFRLVSATHCGLQQMVTAGSFRQDLYFRLAVFPLDVPSLGERPGDLPIIIDRLLDDCLGLARTALRPQFSASAIRALAAHAWTGNIRELRAVIQRATALFAGAEVRAEEVRHNLLSFAPPGIEAAQGAAFAPGEAGNATDIEAVLQQRGALDLRIHVRDIEVTAIESALRHAGGCVSRAAIALHLRRTTLIEKMKKYGIAA
ncbi:MAG: sigma-54 dependent transcriptional regulator [Gemmobacter sp.]|nr:sigma-54 dependent transcriptional regulator [Gemmobacter sp.]